MKKLFLIFILISSCQKFDCNCYTKCTDSFSTVNHWQEFPIVVYTTNQSQIDVLDIYNNVFDREIFQSTTDYQEAQIIIDDSIYIQSMQYNGEDVEILGTAGLDVPDQLGVITFANVSLTSTLDKNSYRYKKVLAHELAHVLGEEEHLCGSITTPCADQVKNIEDGLKSDLFFEWFSETYGN